MPPGKRRPAKGATVGSKKPAGMSWAEFGGRGGQGYDKKKDPTTPKRKKK